MWDEAVARGGSITSQTGEPPGCRARISELAEQYGFAETVTPTGDPRD